MSEPRLQEMQYLRPRTLEEVWRILESTPGARLVAGGTDLMTRVCRREIRPPVLVSLRNIPSLSGIEANGSVRVGAATPLADVLAHPAIRGRYPVLAEAIAAIGSVQIRNVGTVGGNLCNASPCADTAPPLLVLDSRVRLRGPGGDRELPIEDFFVGPGETCVGRGEVLTDIFLPAPAANARSTYMKKGRVAMDLALASVAVHVEMDGARCVAARIAAGAVAPVPLRLKKTEELIVGREVGPDLLLEASAVAEGEIAPITDVRATAEYRRTMVGVFVRRAIERLAGGRAA